MSNQILEELSIYLEKTLSPDPNVRRPGIIKIMPRILIFFLIFLN